MSTILSWGSRVAALVLAISAALLGGYLMGDRGSDEEPKAAIPTAPAVAQQPNAEPKASLPVHVHVPVPDLKSESTPQPMPQSEPKTGETARLFIDFEHHIEKGRVSLAIDGATVWTRDLTARKKERFGIPKLKLAHGELSDEIEVPVGAHLLTVTVKSSGSRVDDTESMTRRFAAGRTHLLKIRVDRITSQVWLSDTQ